jgi:hypothetical protein
MHLAALRWLLIWRLALLCMWLDAPLQSTILANLVRQQYLYTQVHR